ncbi:MAG: DUF962 domain-containing protein [Cyclobacteriaceae bacterium]|nr:DUF962 domain-containing protein [Cyclobacteriaceae bacterium]
MRTEQEFLTEYSKSHNHPTNQLVHMICVPLIFISSFGLLWLIPLGNLIPGLSAEVKPYLNVATVMILPVLIFYFMLSMHSLITGVVWLGASIAVVLLLSSLKLPLLAIFASVWILAWIAQIWGHKVEGAKPSFFDDLVFLLIGPLYVQKKFEGNR